MPRVIRFEAVVGKPKNLNKGEIDSIAYGNSHSEIICFGRFATIKASGSVSYV